MKVSIIIPVYRTEQTLARCIDSVRAQHYADWEAILVDDGSDDGAPALCDSYAALDSRIRVIHQSNAGLGPARNAGLDAAMGDYVWFVDSDDYAAPETLSAAVRAIEACGNEVAFVEFPVYVAYGHKAKQRMLNFSHQQYTDQWQWWFAAEGYTHCYAWNKLFRRSAIGNLRFENRIFEDVFFMLPLLNSAKAMITINEGLYYYCYNTNGITANEGKHLLDLLEAHVRVLKQLNWKCPKGVSTSLFAYYYANLLNVQIDVYDRCRKKVLLKRKPFMQSPKLLLQCVLGVRGCCWLINLIRKQCKISHS